MFAGLLFQLSIGCRPATPNVAVAPSSAPGANTGNSGIDFIDRTANSGVVAVYRNGDEDGRNVIVESIGGGVGLIDFDRDDKVDLIFPGGGRFTDDHALSPYPTSLFRRIAPWKYRDVSAETGAASARGVTHGTAVADFDNDGFPDVAITAFGPPQLWRNEGDGTFSDVSASLDIRHDLFTTSAGWGDFDGDGSLDLYLTQYVDWSWSNNPPCRGRGGVPDVCPPREFRGLDDWLLMSNGQGQFRNESEARGLSKGGKGLGVLIGDLDLDGDCDAYVANDTVENFLYINQGSGHFAERALELGCALDDRGVANGSMGVDATDFDDDGLPDLFVTNYEQENSALYRAAGAAGYFFASHEAGISALGELYVSFGAGFGDFDSDGDEDLVILNGHVMHTPQLSPVLQLPVLLERSGPRFVRRAATSGFFATPRCGRGFAIGDLDEDGDLDFISTQQNGPPVLLENRSPSVGPSVQVRLVGRRSNRDGIGASASLASNGRTMIRLVKGGASYLSSSSRDLHWGVNVGDQLPTLTVRWPGRSDAVPVDMNSVPTSAGVSILVEPE